MTVTGILLIITLFILILNIPFGYWRANVRKLTLQWYLAIHLPVPVIIGLRLTLNLGWHWSTFVLFIFAFGLGQFLGGILNRRMASKYHNQISSCLFMDICCKHRSHE
jgi:hypothetical protein